MAIWEEIGLIGRDNILEKEIAPRLNHPSNRFIIEGEPGSGKTAILEWCAKHTEGRVAYVSASQTNTIIVHAIVEQLELDVEGTKISDYEAAILGSEGFTIYIDDLHAASEKTLHNFTLWAERHKVCGAKRNVQKPKEDLKKFLWSVKPIRLPRLDKKSSEILAKKMCIAEASKISYKEVARESDGLPGRMLTFCKTGEIQKNAAKLHAEEIDISPILLIIAAIPILFRVIGRATDATDLTVIGGISILILLLMRMILQSGKE